MKMAEFSNQVENTLGKGEVAHYHHFLLVPVFSRLVLQTCKIKGLFWKKLKNLQKESL